MGLQNKEYDFLRCEFTSQNYGQHFDDLAKVRMREGSLLLAPWIENECAEEHGWIVEFGPFLDPLANPAVFSHANITFVDGDVVVVTELNRRYAGDARVRTVWADLKTGDDRGHLRKSICGGVNLFASVLIASQILNYIDYREFFALATSLAQPGAHFFINNVVDYGIPELFADKRPQHDCEILASLETLGWRVRKIQSIPSFFVEQANPRLLLHVTR